ncbi:MAG: SDR family NAD(P)-dependent oxidoreductase [Lachnospiraceae bacterium]|nr:SDR family NAD(P)-dependent oxidoreductase [Lachnospiraceae bacterium]
MKNKPADSNDYVLVTGASRGIGKETALTFAAHGHNLIILSRQNAEKLDEVKNAARQSGVKCLSFLTDVSDYNSVLQLKQRLQDLQLSVSAIINNAGISFFGLLQDTGIEDWEQVINTNLSSCFYICKAFIPQMIARQSGHIINISSVWGNVGAACEVAYSASKGGVNAFTKALAKELAPSGISVNAIACGAIDTEMNSRLSDEERQELEYEIPFGRMGTVSETAELIYSITVSNPYLTGQIITLDGGWT